jgi:DNA polymerase-3 subunit delta
MHATEFLAAAEPDVSVRVIVMYGSERFLKQECLKQIPGCEGDDEDFALVRIAGAAADWRDVSTELSTLSMFGDQRVVLIEDADEFVSENRQSLEKYVQKPARGSLLILDVKSWPGNTRLAKAVAASGLPLECNPLKGATLVQWLQRVATEQYQKSLDRNSAQLIIQLAGNSLGLLQQEVAKLASLAGDAERITEEDVRRVVGGWKLETTWAMLDAVRDGDLNFAFTALEKLLRAGDAPQKVLGGTAFVYRKLAHATELARTGTPLGEALRTAGVMPMAVGQSERYLRRIGYDRARRILHLLADADHDMKGGSRVDAQLLLERLFVELSGAPASAAGG